MFCAEHSAVQSDTCSYSAPQVLLLLKCAATCMAATANSEGLMNMRQGLAHARAAPPANAESNSFAGRRFAIGLANTFAPSNAKYAAVRNGCFCHHACTLFSAESATGLLRNRAISSCASLLSQVLVTGNRLCGGSSACDRDRLSLIRDAFKRSTALTSCPNASEWVAFGIGFGM